MADPQTDYAENLLCRWVTKGEVVPAGTRHVLLFSAMPTDAGGGTEIEAGGILRIAMAAANWAIPTVVDGGYQFASSADCLWATVTTAQADAIGFGIADAAAAGNLLWYAEVRDVLTLPVGKRPVILAGGLKGLVGATGDPLQPYSQNLYARWFSKGEVMAAGSRYMFLADATGTEITGDGFVRVLMASGDWNAPVDYNGGKRADNLNPLPFVAPTLDKPNAAQWGIADALAGGNVLYKGSLLNTVSLPAGRVLTFPAGFFRVTIGA